MNTNVATTITAADSGEFDVLSLLRTEDPKKYILRSIHDARVAARLQPIELEDLAGLSPTARFHDGGIGDLGLNDVLSLTAVLGIEHDRIMPLKELSNEARAFWQNEMDAAEAGPVAAVDGRIDLDPEVALRLYVRFEALKKLFPN